MSARRRSLGVAAYALALTLAVLAGACGDQRSEEEIESSNPVPVTVAAARLGDIEGELRLAGVVTAAPGAELVVVAPAPARIAALPHAEGDRVRKGDLLVRFETPNLQADAAGRRADLARGESHVAAAQAELARLTGLFARGIAAQREVEAAKKDLADAQAEVASARSAAAAASTVAGRSSVRAPFDGIVTARLHNPGDLVDASAADPVLRLVDPSRLQVEAAVPLASVRALALGQPARVLDASGERVAAGRVVALPAAVDPTTGAAKVRIAVDGAPALPLSAPVTVAIATAEHPRAVVVPTGAIAQEGPQAFVFVIGADQHAHRRAVRTGIGSGGEVEVLQGVRAGERVVVEGQNGLPDGAAVTVQRGGASAAMVTPAP